MTYLVSIAEGVEVAVDRLIARPSKPLTDKAFKYKRAAETDITKTWDKARKAMKEAKAAQPKKPESVVSIKRKSA